MTRSNHKQATYDQVKTAVIKAGRFSAFEASERPAIFNRMWHDDGLTLTRIGYPWVEVRRKAK